MTRRRFGPWKTGLTRWGIEVRFESTGWVYIRLYPYTPNISLFEMSLFEQGLTNHAVIEEIVCYTEGNRE